MELKPDCVRGLLLAIEQCIVWDDDLHSVRVDFCELMSSHELSGASRADVGYTAKILLEAGLIEARIVESDARILNIVFFGLSHSGHEFLANIRDKKDWNAIISKAGTISLTLLIEAAKIYMSNKLTGLFQPPANPL